MAACFIMYKFKVLEIDHYNHTCPLLKKADRKGVENSSSRAPSVLQKKKNRAIESILIRITINILDIKHQCNI